MRVKCTFCNRCASHTLNPTPFTALNLPEPVIANLKQLGYHQTTPIQAASLPEIAAGHDLIAKAQTGSGKTAAFGIGALMKLNPKRYQVQILVLCPTRELAGQVATELRRLARFQPNTKVVSICGGVPIGPQIGSLQHGAHVVVGTPGRIKDHLRKGTLKLDAIHTLVLDEADRMLEMGFNQDIRDICSHTPGTRQTLLFSATYPEAIQSLSADFQTTPKEVSVEAPQQTGHIDQQFYRLEKSADKADALVRLLHAEEPESCILFCNTKQQCYEIRDHLRDTGFVTHTLQGDMEQRERDQVLVAFANRSCSLLVATDVAARGIDIDDLDLVINVDLPRDPAVYEHRIGRTGRAGRDGVAISLCTTKEQYKVEAIEEHTAFSVDYQTLPKRPSGDSMPPRPKMVTLCIAGGRKQKVRAGDILGALTSKSDITGAQVGKINVLDFASYVAVERPIARKALEQLSKGKIKGRSFKVRRL